MTLIEKYCKEITPNLPPMTLEELIESHRSLRETNLSFYNRWKEKLHAAIEKHVKMVIDDRYVLWSELESMTLAEIVLRF